MRSMTWLVAVSVIFCLNGAAIGAEKAEESVSGEQVKKQAEATLDEAKKYTMEQKEAFQKKMESEIRDLSKQIDQFKEKAVAAQGETLTALQTKLAELKDKQKAAEQKLEEFKSSTAKAWEQTRTNLQAAVDDLKKAYEGVGKLFK
jgi:polyhydroxyalkanoate synthesis regulator phasin